MVAEESAAIILNTGSRVHTLKRRAVLWLALAFLSMLMLLHAFSPSTHNNIPHINDMMGVKHPDFLYLRVIIVRRILGAKLLEVVLTIFFS